MNECYPDEEKRKNCTITTNETCKCITVDVDGGSMAITYDMENGLNFVVRLFRNAGFDVEVKG